MAQTIKDEIERTHEPMWQLALGMGMMVAFLVVLIAIADIHAVIPFATILGGYSLLLALLFGIYFLPAIIANRRHHRNSYAITVLDTLLGWTLIGWIGALVWASTADIG